VEPDPQQELLGGLPAAAAQSDGFAEGDHGYGAQATADLLYGAAYQKRSEEEFVVDHRQRMEKSLYRRAKELGYELRKVERPAEAEPQLA